MSRPKVNWHLKTKELEKQNKNLNSEVSRVNYELRQVEESYERSKKVWRQQEDDFLMQQTQLDRQVFNLRQELSAAQHTNFVLAEKLIRLRDEAIYNDNMNTFLALKNSKGENQCLTEAPQIMQRNK